MPRPSLKLSGVFVAVVVVGLLISWIVRSGPVAVAVVGSPAPDFTAELIDGGTVTLSELQGEPVILNFWASWCAPCRAEIPAISAFADAHPGIRVIGVAVEDTEAESRKFAAEIGATYPLALGDDEIEDAYPRIGLPVTYVIDETGVVTEIFNGIVTEESLSGLAG